MKIEIPTAEEAYEKSRINKENILFQKIPDRLLDNISSRISDACYGGKFKCSLNSITDEGEIVRGIGVYLSPNMLVAISKYFEKIGYKAECNYDKVSGNIQTAWLSWEIVDPPGDE
jgi:hypothetical protein